MRKIAGVSVIDTPLVRAAQDFARQEYSDFLYNHVMRTWLFGALILKHNDTLSQTADFEAHAVSALLHDLGLTQNPQFVTSDRRFEVDGAFAARDFVAHNHNSSHWDDRRLQLVWDGIALHAEHTISIYKEPSVQVTTNGVWMDFLFNPLDFGITSDEHDPVVSAFPHLDLYSGFNSSFIWLCQNKPSATYDNWVEPWGDQFVANYTPVNRVFDVITGL
ncbi:hypothetical protein GQ53DRAFT_650439 [Thozetella sp. PMI_491]|nr:hypothetical protein GQ53DRAFT_650439 [Thozetella sp. PMI_491]